MKSEIASLGNASHSTPVLSGPLGSLPILDIEPHDTLQNVLAALRSHTSPLILVLSQTRLFHQPDAFARLRKVVDNDGQPLVVHLIISSAQTKEHQLAAQFHFSASLSVEDAVQFLRSSSPQNTGGQVLSPSSSRDTDQLSRAALSQALNPHPKARRRTFVMGSVLTLLVLASVLFLPPLLAPTPARPAAGEKLVGTMAFGSSGQIDPTATKGYNDTITLTLSHLPSPASGRAYYAWLMPDTTDDTTLPLLLGTSSRDRITLTYASPDHTNLLASYSGIRVTEQAANSTPVTPSLDPATWRWEGWITSTPTPGDENQYSLLSHLRHLLARDPTLRANDLPGGLSLWLTRNVAKVEEWASAAQGQWHDAQTSDADADLIHRHMLRILDYLDGQFYVWRDVPANSPWLVDPLAGKIGLINSNARQNPPAYLPHVDVHLTGLSNSPGHTQEQQKLAILVDSVIQKMNRDLEQVRKDASELVKMSADQLRQAGNLEKLNDMVNLTTEVKSGWFDEHTGENTGSVLWMTARLQQLASVPVHVSHQRG